MMNDDEAPVEVAEEPEEETGPTETPDAGPGGPGCEKCD